MPLFPRPTPPSPLPHSPAPYPPALFTTGKILKEKKKSNKCCGNITSSSLPPLLPHTPLLRAPASSSITLLSLGRFPLDPLDRCYQTVKLLGLKKIQLKERL